MDETAFKNSVEEKIRDTQNQESRKELQRYVDTKRANGVKWRTLSEHARSIMKLANRFPKKSVLELERDDLNSHVAALLDVLADSTVTREKVALKDFYKHRHPDGDPEAGDYPAAVKGLKTSAGRNNGRELTKSDLLSREQVRNMIENSASSKDRAAIAVLYESGARAAEFLSLNIGDVDRVQHGIEITFNPKGGSLKTGSRTVLLIDSAPYLESWLKDHPVSEGPGAPVWWSEKGGGRLTRSGLYHLIDRVRDAAIPDKELSPKIHIFRHSRATEMTEKGFSEAMLRQYFGWARGSDMPSRYAHLAGHEVHEERQRRRGLIEGEEDGEDALEPWHCPRGHTTEATAKFCSECGMPRSREALIEVEEAEATGQQDLATLLSEDPRLAAQYNALVEAAVGEAAERAAERAMEKYQQG